MLCRTLPGTSLSLSVIGLGCWTLGNEGWGTPVDDQTADDTVRAAVEAGVNWLDTAPLYGDGHADAVVARARRAHPGLIVATKVGARVEAGHARSDLRPEALRADAEASLRRLGRIDLLQVHWPCERGTPLEDTIGALQALVDAGHIGAVGLCNFDADGLQRARAQGAVASLQTPYSLLRREFEGALREECATPRGDPPQPIGVLAYETLCRGLLSGKHKAPPRFHPSDIRARDPRFRGLAFGVARGLSEDLARVAEKVGAPQVALATGWVLSRPGVTAAVVGARSAAQIVEVARAVPLLGRARLWSVIDRLAAAHGGIPRG